MKKKKILLVGLGNLGGHVLDLLTKHESQHEIVVAGRSEAYLNQRKNLALFCAAQQNIFPNVSHRVIDLTNIDQTAATLKEINPDIIFSTATLQSWRIITTLPKDVFLALDQAEFGPWLPMHLVPVHQLMQAVKNSGIKAIVVNAAFPDAVNAILAKVGLAPTVGIGNVANILPAFKYSVASELNTSPDLIDLRLIGQHYLSHRIPRVGNTGGAAYHLSAFHKGKDVSDQLNHERVFQKLTSQFKRIGGVDGQALTAASALSVLSVLLNNKKDVVHAPGPNGLPGGYPIQFDGNKILLALPTSVSLKEAVAINNNGLKFDGIDSIDESGTTFFSSNNMEIMNHLVGYRQNRMTLEDAEGMSRELAQKYAAFSSRYK